jgi:hypothetical protein
MTWPSVPLTIGGSLNTLPESPVGVGDWITRSFVHTEAILTALSRYFDR